MHRAVDDLRASAVAGRVLRVGERMPAFTLPSAAGAPVDSRRLLASGPLVVTFYRGRW
jgi:peroxiredoxin